jgi:hypothetical protein
MLNVRASMRHSTTLHVGLKALIEIRLCLQVLKERQLSVVNNIVSRLISRSRLAPFLRSFNQACHERNSLIEDMKKLCLHMDIGNELYREVTMRKLAIFGLAE